MQTQRAFFLTVSVLALLGLSACQKSDIPVVGQSLDSLTGRHTEAEKRIATEAAVAIAQGKTAEALGQYKKLYEDNSYNKDIATNYAQLLRKNGRADEAEKVLHRLVFKNNGTMHKNVPPLLLNEYAAGQVELGKLEEAEKILNLVLEDARAKPYHNDAYNLMGITLDAKGEHKEAENMFRLALDSWKGDKTSVMNNLAMSLASQGLFDDSLMTLREALIMAPGKEEIARNIELVEKLRSAIVPKAPTKLED